MLEPIPTPSGVELEIKRFYPEISFKDKCPKCGNEVEFDLKSQYLSYVNVGALEHVSAWCDHCEDNVLTDVVIGVTTTPTGEYRMEEG